MGRLIAQGVGHQEVTVRALVTLFVAGAGLGGAALGGVLALTLGPHGMLRRIRHLEHLALTDPLTGLSNRRLLDHLDEVAPTDIDGDVWAVVGDLDGFKAINDHHGHPVGDALLQSVAAVLRTHTRPGDLVVRLGGDEFALVLWSCSAEEATAVLTRIQQRVGELTPQCSISFGVSDVRSMTRSAAPPVGPLTRSAVLGALADADAALMGRRRRRDGPAVLVVHPDDVG